MPSGSSKSLWKPQFQQLRVASGTLKVDHKGGPISVYHSHIVNGVCGSVGYRLYYGDGPVFRDGEYDFRNELNNDEFNATELGYDVAVTAYQAAAGCVLGQAGQKGGYLDSVHSAIPGWNSAINDDVTESTPYMVGHLACSVVFPEYSIIRDFLADGARGDLLGVAINGVGVGYLAQTHNLLGTGSFITALIAKSPRMETGVRIINDLYNEQIYERGLQISVKVPILDKTFGGSASRLAAKYGMNTNTMDNLVLDAKQPLQKIETFLDTTATGNWVSSRTLSAEEYSYSHYLDHVKTKNEWGTDIGFASYKQRATDLLNRRDASVELYYQKGKDTLAVYDRTNSEFVSGTINGDITTFFKPDNRGAHYIDETIRDSIFRLN